MKSVTIYLTIMTMLTLVGAAYSRPDSLWSRTYGGPGDDVCEAIVLTTDGGFAMAGKSNSFGEGPRDYNAFMVRTTDCNSSALVILRLRLVGVSLIAVACRCMKLGQRFAGNIDDGFSILIRQLVCCFQTFLNVIGDRHRRRLHRADSLRHLRQGHIIEKASRQSQQHRDLRRQ